MRFIKTFFIFLLIPFYSFAAYAPTAPTLTVGGRTYTDLTNLIELSCYAAGNNNCTFRAPNGSAGYAVTTGKTLKIQSFRCFVITSASNTGTGWLLYADNDVGVNTATAFTNGVRYGGSAASGYLASFGSLVSSGYFEGPISYSIPAGKYPGIQGNDTGVVYNCKIYGYEI